MFLGMFLGICSAEYQREDPKNPHYSPTPPDPTHPFPPYPQLLKFGSTQLLPHHTTPHPTPSPHALSLPLHLISSHLTSTKQYKTKQNKTM